MKPLAKYSSIALLSFFVMALATVIENNVERRDARVEEATEEAEKAETKVMALEDALAMKERQRLQTQKVIDFMLDNPRFAVIEADRAQTILSVRGDVDVIGWDRETLEGRLVSDMVELDDRDEHSRAYVRRVSAGKSGEVHLFEDEIGLTESGEGIALRGLVLWHHDRGLSVAFIAPIE
jgi:PAS domain-containing protein